MRTVTMSLPPELKEKVDEEKGKIGALNRSEFIRIALVDYLDEIDELGDLDPDEIKNI